MDSEHPYDENKLILRERISSDHEEILFVYFHKEDAEVAQVTWFVRV